MSSNSASPPLFEDDKQQPYTSEQHDSNDITPTTLAIPSVSWYKDPGLRRLYMMMPILFLGSTTNGYDGSLLNGLQTMDAWQSYFDNPNATILGLFSAILQIGALCAIFFFSYLADWLGRKKGVATGIVVLLVGMVLQVVPSVNRGMFIGGRFLVGLGSNLTQGSAPLLILELAHPAHRGKLTTMYNTLWYLGSIIAAWTVFGTQGYGGNAAWKIPVGIQGLMPCVQLVAGIWLLPESPRWLIFKDRGDDAMRILTKYHANGDSSSEFVRAEFAEIQLAISLEKEYKKQGWQVWTQTAGNRKRLMLIGMVAFFSQCSGNGLVSYYLHDILNSVGVTSTYDQDVYNGGLQVWSFLVAIGFSAMLVDRLGRKKLFLIAGIGMLVTFTIWTACSAVYANTGNVGAGRAVLALIFLFYGIAGFAWPGLTIAYCIEILPYNIRAKGLAMNLAFTSCASILNQYVNPIGLERIHWKFYFVYIVILVIEVLCIWFLFVETKGHTLEEVAVLFDGPQILDESKAKGLDNGGVTKSDAEHVEDAA